MRLTDKQAENIGKCGVWVDYYKGYPNIPDIIIKSNNWRKIHGLPLFRKKRSKK